LLRLSCHTVADMRRIHSQNAIYRNPALLEELEKRVLLSAVTQTDTQPPEKPEYQLAVQTIPTFTDISASIGLNNVLAGKAAFADYNNDGWVDLYASDHLWLNDRGHFTKLNEDGFDNSGIWADYNNDGYLDLFLFSDDYRLYEGVDGMSFVETTHKLPADEMDSLNPRSRGATWGDWNGDGYIDLYVGGYESPYHPDLMLLNQQAERFEIIWVQSGDIDPSRGITAADYDEDGDQDIYVSNYRVEQNQLWQNDGHANFTNVGPTAGVAGDYDGWSYSYGHTIGSAWGDLDSDGHLDLFVGNFSHPAEWQDRPKFYRNLGPEDDYKFEDRSSSAGLAWQESYVSPSLADFDNDGYLDFFLTTGYSGDHDVLYRNNGDWTFSRVDTEAGIAVTENYQAAWADIDNDGDLDLLTGGRLYRNNGNSNNWLKVRLEGGGSVNRAAIGAQVRIALGNKTITRQVEGATGEGNQNDLTLHFGLGQESDPVNVQVTWPNGETFALETPINQTLAVRYGQGATKPEPIKVNFADPKHGGPVEQALYSIAPGDHFLRRISPLSGKTLDTKTIDLPEHTIKGAMGLATHPTTGQLHALLKLDGQVGRELVTLDTLTGNAVSLGDTGHEFVDLTFGDDATLYAVTGDAASKPETLFELNLDDGSATHLVHLGHGNAGEAIAFNPDDDLIYHASGSGAPNTSEIFETVHPQTLQFDKVNLNGDNYNKAMALAYHEERGVFLTVDFNQKLYTISPDGQVNHTGSLGHRSKGLSFAPRWPLLVYDTQQEVNGSFLVEEDNTTLRLTGNIWTALEMSYEVTSNTVLEFDFASSAQGEVHGIGFDDNLLNTPSYRFNLYGSQQSDQAHNDFNDYDVAPENKHYTIPVGSFFSGTMDYMTFVNDHDVPQPSAESVFRNVTIYEYDPDATITYPFSEDFDDGTADRLAVVSGSGGVNGSGQYEISPRFGTTPISMVSLGDTAPDQLTMTAAMTIPGEGMGFYHGVLIFDYQAVDDFKFAGGWEGKNEWRIGHVNASQWVVDARVESNVDLDTPYDLELVLDHGKVTLAVDGQEMVDHDFDRSLDGSVGLGAKRATVQFDDLFISDTIPQFPIVEDFDDGTADRLKVVSGSGKVNESGRYEVAPLLGNLPIALFALDGPVPDQLTIHTGMQLPSGGTGFHHGFVIFDYQAIDDFKFAGGWDGKNEWRIGHRDGSNWITDAHFEDEISIEAFYNLDVVLNGGQATLIVNGKTMTTHDFSQPLTGSIGLGTKRSVARFDNIVVTNTAAQAAPLSLDGNLQVVDLTDLDGDLPLDVTSTTQILWQTEDWEIDGGNTLGFPAVVKNNRGLNPDGKYYLYYAKHDPMSGIGVAVADTVTGPYIKISPPNSQVLVPSGGSENQHFSSPKVVWNKDTQRWHLYFHFWNSDHFSWRNTMSAGFGHQMTAVATTDDLSSHNWTPRPGDPAVVNPAFDPVLPSTSDRWINSQSSYHGIYRLPNGAWMAFMRGTGGKYNGADWSQDPTRIGIATSNDGINWNYLSQNPILHQKDGSGSPLGDYAPEFIGYLGKNSNDKDKYLLVWNEAGQIQYGTTVNFIDIHRDPRGHANWPSYGGADNAWREGKKLYIFTGRYVHEMTLPGISP